MHIKKYKLKYNTFVIVCVYQAGKKKKKKERTSLMMLLLWQVGGECTPSTGGWGARWRKLFCRVTWQRRPACWHKDTGQLQTARCQSEQTEEKHLWCPALGEREPA